MGILEPLLRMLFVHAIIYYNSCMINIYTLKNNLVTDVLLLQLQEML